MKVGIIGAGAVGSACALALVMRGAAREVVLVDRTRQRARAVATDIRYGTPLSPEVDMTSERHFVATILHPRPVALSKIGPPRKSSRCRRSVCAASLSRC